MASGLLHDTSSRYEYPTCFNFFDTGVSPLFLTVIQQHNPTGPHAEERPDLHHRLLSYSISTDFEYAFASFLR